MYRSHWPNYNCVIQYPRVTLISNPDFDLSINLVQPQSDILMTFVHLDIYYFTPKVLKKLLTVWPMITKLLPPIIYCHGEVSDRKFDRFVRLFGWKPLVDARCTDGTNRTIYYQIRKES